MDREIIEQKLESLRRCLKRVAQKCPSDPETLEQDPDLQDIITLNLTRAIQLCVDIGAHLIAGMEEISPPETMGKTFDILAQSGAIPEELASRLKKAIGFRNIGVHNYEAIDWSIVHAIASRHLDDFAEFVKAIIAELEN
jgi:uncharacterized protein YutE (UPF0331/DUF86 family)